MVYRLVDPGWPKDQQTGVFLDPSLAAALIDRLLHNGEIYHIMGPSYRLRRKTAVDEPQAKTQAKAVIQVENKSTATKEVIPSSR